VRLEAAVIGAPFIGWDGEQRGQERGRRRRRSNQCRPFLKTKRRGRGDAQVPFDEGKCHTSVLRRQNQSLYTCAQDVQITRIVTIW
jgi:hypothetical protein